ncbi:MAG: hypothetical protein ACE5J9_06800, partial [Methanosarcinales archaeon]
MSETKTNDNIKRDIIIERLERKLAEKEHEIANLKDTLKESILEELRTEIKEILEFNKRIIGLEKKINEMSNTMDGLMRELLDQKSALISLQKSKERTPTSLKFKSLAPDASFRGSGMRTEEPESIENITRKPSNSNGRYCDYIIARDGRENDYEYTEKNNGELIIAE